ncbi:MAG: DDE transposase, partial [Bacilli bacterium]|nr:DDE transposase [Bacilli bacterium]
IDGDEHERSYKHHQSDYAEWEHRDHASKWKQIEDNLCENLSIDETKLQEDLVTIHTNKAGHCKQG